MSDVDDALTFLNKIQTQYPQAISILSQPGVAAVYKQAVDGNWSGDRLEAALEQTQWWQTSTAETRKWQALQATDPGTAGTKMEQTRRMVDDLERQLGVSLTDTHALDSSNPKLQFLINAVTYGWDANEIRYRMLDSVNATHSGGELASTAAKIKSLADEYGAPMYDGAVLQFARQMSEGALDEAGMRGYLIETAKSLYPALSDALDRGVTVKQYAAPYLQLAQQELGVDPNTVSLTDQKWMAAMNQVDPKTGARVPMALDTWLAKIRTDPQYGYDSTDKGRNDATALATQLQQKFGAAA